MPGKGKRHCKACSDYVAGHNGHVGRGKCHNAKQDSAIAATPREKGMAGPDDGMKDSNSSHSSSSDVLTRPPVGIHGADVQDQPFISESIPTAYVQNQNHTYSIPELNICNTNIPWTVPVYTAAAWSIWDSTSNRCYWISAKDGHRSSIWAYSCAGHITIWSYGGDFTIWSYAEHFTIWSYAGHFTIWSYAGYFSIWSYAGHFAIWSYAGHFAIWSHTGHLMTRGCTQ